MADGNVTVDYALYNGEGYVSKECVAWFGSMDEITAEFMNDPQSDLAFGQAVSIGDDLAGAEKAILFICNTATYRQPYNGKAGYLSRYWENRECWVTYREGLTEILDSMAK